MADRSTRRRPAVDITHDLFRHGAHVTFGGDGAAIVGTVPPALLTEVAVRQNDLLALLQEFVIPASAPRAGDELILRVAERIITG